MNEMSKQKIQLGDIQKTPLIPLYGRATETQKKNGLIYDPAFFVVAAIDYNFSNRDGNLAFVNACCLNQLQPGGPNNSLISQAAKSVQERHL